MKNCLLALCGILTGLALVSFGQPIKPKNAPPGAAKAPNPAIPMGIMVKAYENSVAIRWSPSEAISWEMGKQYGYHVFRQEYVNQQRIGTEQQLTTLPIRPVTEEELKKYTDTSEVAKKALFSVTSAPTTDASLEEALKKDESRNFTFGMALIMANVYPLVAKLSGLMYTDATVVPYRTYYYEVRLNHPDLGKTVRAWAVTTPGATQTKSPMPFQFSGKSIKRNAVLQWRTDFVGFSYAYYDVYRSEHHDRGYKKLNKLPYVGFMSGTDEPNITKFQDTLPRLDKC